MDPHIRPSEIICDAIRSALKKGTLFKIWVRNRVMLNDEWTTFVAGISRRAPSSWKVMLLYSLLAERRLCSMTARSRMLEPVVENKSFSTCNTPQFHNVNHFYWNVIWCVKLKKSFNLHYVFSSDGKLKNLTIWCRCLLMFLQEGGELLKFGSTNDAI